MMMRKKTKMAWSVALSAAMAAGLLAGCGSNGGTESTSGSTATSSAKTESSASDTTDTSDRPTYKIATVRWTDTWPTDFLHEGVMKEIEDKMNINIDWQVYYNSDWSEQKSLLLASGDLPDAFLGSICLTQADMAQNKSAFLDRSPRTFSGISLRTLLQNRLPRALWQRPQNRFYPSYRG